MAKGDRGGKQNFHTRVIWPFACNLMWFILLKNTFKKMHCMVRLLLHWAATNPLAQRPPWHCSMAIATTLLLASAHMPLECLLYGCAPPLHHRQPRSHLLVVIWAPRGLKILDFKFIFEYFLHSIPTWGVFAISWA